MRPRTPLTIAAGAALVLVGVIATPVAGSPGAIAAAAQAEHDRIVAYWTPQRMASAIPRDMVSPGSPVLPTAKGGIPGPPGGGGGGGSGGVTGTAWPDGTGAVVTQTGKVYFVVFPYAYVCSGSVVSDGRSGYSVVLTAGHCVWDSKKGFVQNWLFIPDFDASPVSGYPPACNQTWSGCWTAQALVVDQAFASQKQYNTTATRNDWGFAVVGPGGTSGTAQLDNTVGGGYTLTTSVSSGDRLAALGYPAASPYNGNDLIYCAGNIFSDSNNGNYTWGMKCDMTGGASGGPWLVESGSTPFSESTGNGGAVGSLNSYRYNGGDSLYGPKFNSETIATYNVANANGTTSNTIVP